LVYVRGAAVQHFNRPQAAHILYAVHCTSDPWTGRQARQLAYIAEFTSDIKHINGKDNVVEETLARPSPTLQGPAAPITAVAASPTNLDFNAIVAGQAGCAQTQQAASFSALRVRPVVLGGVTLLCDMSTGASRPLIPADHRQTVFIFHCLAHPGVRDTRRLLAAKVVWPGMVVGRWCRECQDCARGKVTVQPAAAVTPISVPGERFSHIHMDSARLSRGIILFIHNH
jgi:Integrase zinc binding domain